MKTFYSWTKLKLVFRVIAIIVITLNQLTAQELKVVAHRASAALYPENTLIAVKNTIENTTADMIEIDVRLTSDGEVAVLHDASIDRTTDGKGKINTLKYDDLCKYDAGIKFSQLYKNERIPLLKQVLECVNGKKELLIEIKDENNKEELSKKVCKLLEEKRAYSWCIVQAFNKQVLDIVHSINKDIKIAGLASKYSPKNAGVLSDSTQLNEDIVKDYYYSMDLQHSSISKELVMYFHKKGIKVFAWTVNNKTDIDKLKSFSIDGIITDNPANVAK